MIRQNQTMLIVAVIVHRFAWGLPGLLFILTDKTVTVYASKTEMRGGDLWLSLDATAS